MLRVVIVNNSKSVYCKEGCGWDWSKPEHLKLASERLGSRYGAEVQLEYVDVAGSDEKPGEAGEVERFPRLFINGKMKIAGDFDMRMLLDAVEVESEIGG